MLSLAETETDRWATMWRDPWPDPRPLPGGLLPVEPFDCALLPGPFRPWVSDIAERMQTPPEFVAVPAMVAAGSIIGRKVGIRPLRHDDWQEVPNLWGCIVGRPGVMKSPAVKHALKPLARLEAEANERFQHEREEWQAGQVERELRRDASKAKIKKLLQDNPAADVSAYRVTEDQEPTARRYKANDSTYQALGELLRHNPNGVLVHRDEIMSLLRALDREDSCEARGFYLTGWNGSESYTFDRIGRGANLHVPSVTISLLGSTQPGLMQSYVRSVMGGGGTDDGLLQRFGMIVWPDMPSDWQEHDREPDSEHRARAFGAFTALDLLTPESVGAEADQFDKSSPFLRFGGEAQELFKDWRRGHERRLRQDELHAALESHLAKYRKLVPALALIHHLASGEGGPVGVSAVLAALAWADFLESHAQRIYHAGAASAVDGAKAVVRHLKRGALESPFTVNEIAHKNWSPLGEDRQRINDALDLLEDRGWLRSLEAEPGPQGGRPTKRFVFNPKAIAA